MKLRVWKAQVNKALLWYTEKLTEKHYPNLFLTPAKVELLKRDLEHFQHLIQKTEPNPIWRVPVQISVDLENGRFAVVADESVLLYLDPE